MTDASKLTVWFTYSRGTTTSEKKCCVFFPYNWRPVLHPIKTFVWIFLTLFHDNYVRLAHAFNYNDNVIHDYKNTVENKSNHIYLARPAPECHIQPRPHRELGGAANICQSSAGSGY